MLTILTSKHGESETIQFLDSQTKEANDKVLALKADPETEKIICTKADGTVVIIKEEPNIVYIVDVLFDSTSTKCYSYVSHTSVKVGAKVIVPTYNGIKIVTVQSCYKTEKTNLVNICKSNNPKYVMGLFCQFKR